jgi:hypothetical protein
MLDFLKLNLKSWTVRLGALSAVLVALSAVIPALDVLLSAVFPVAKPWLVVASMYIGRALGLLKQAQTAIDAVQGG